MKTKKTISQWIRSLLFSIIMIVITIPYSFISLCAKPFPLKYRYGLIMCWTSMMVWFLKVICRVDYRIEGLENIPKDRVAVILSKHQSTWETFYLPTLFNQAAIILKKELLYVPFFGWGLGITDPIAIDRKDPKSAMDQIIQQGKKYLDAGRFILVFPEGTRIPPGQIGKYRLGGARLASVTGYPVIPVAHNAGKYWKKRGFYKVPGTIRLIIGPIIETKNRPPEEVLHEAKNWIESTILKLP